MNSGGFEKQKMNHSITNFYVHPYKIEVEKGFITIEGEEANHIKNVLHYDVDDIIDVVDGIGTRYHCQIYRNDPNSVTVKILSRTRRENEAITQITLAQALCKGPRFDLVVEKCTEIGVTSIIPLISERTLVKPEGGLKQFNRLERWKRVAISSLKQSLRTCLPNIQKITGFENLCSQIKNFDLTLIAHPEKGARNLKELPELKKNPRDILLLVGPEGGFTDAEIARAKNMGAITITLGTRRFRSETAGIIFSALVLAQLEDLG